jgi:hypothetical protein
MASSGGSDTSEVLEMKTGQGRARTEAAVPNVADRDTPTRTGSSGTAGGVADASGLHRAPLAGEEALAAPDSVPVDVFNGLLRSLVTWQLVVPGDGDTSQWLLSDLAQQRLSALAPPPVEAGQITYFDHRCTNCGERHLTRASKGNYLCPKCERASRARSSAATGSPDHGRADPRIAKERLDEEDDLPPHGGPPDGRPPDGGPPDDGRGRRVIAHLPRRRDRHEGGPYESSG